MISEHKDQQFNCTTDQTSEEEIRQTCN